MSLVAATANRMAAAAAKAYNESLRRADRLVGSCTGLISECEEEDRNAGCRDLADFGL